MQRSDSSLLNLQHGLTCYNSVPIASATVRGEFYTTVAVRLEMCPAATLAAAVSIRHGNEGRDSGVRPRDSPSRRTRRGDSAQAVKVDTRQIRANESGKEDDVELYACEPGQMSESRPRLKPACPGGQA